MTVKSIIDLQINSSEFERFKSMFDKYQEALSKQPDKWAQIGKAQAAAASAMERVASATADQTEGRGEEKSKEQFRRLGESEKLWHNISNYSGTLYKNELGVGTGLLKWGGAIASIATGAGLLGFDRLAENLAGTRQQAMGLPNTSPAQLQAFGVNMSRFVDPGSFLGKMSQMETNSAAATPWYELVRGRMTGNTTQDALAFLNAERQFALRTPLNQLGNLAGAYGLPSSLDELVRMRQTGDTEWNRQQAATARDAKNFGVTNKRLLGFQDFKTAMERNKTTFIDRLGTALTGLTGPLTNLSTAFTRAATVFVESPALKHGLQDLSTWLNKFSGSIDTKAFDSKIQKFASDAVIVADGMGAIASWMGKLGLGNLAAGYGAFKGGQVGAGIGGLIGGPAGAVVGGLGGAALTGGGIEIYEHKDAIGNALADFFLGSPGPPGVSGSWTPAGAPSGASGSWKPNTNPGVATGPIIRVDVMNATGGSAVVSINGLAGGR